MRRMAVIVLFLSHAAAWAGPEIVFERTNMDAGKLQAHDTYSFVFPFTNKGDEPLVIREVTRTCGCTAPRLNKLEYAPGETGEIQVIFFPEGYWGPTRKSVQVISNDPRKRSVRLTMMVDVVAPVVPETGSVLFADISGGSSLEKRIRLENRTDGNVSAGPVSVLLSDRQQGFMNLTGIVESAEDGDMELVLHLSVPKGKAVPGDQRVHVKVPFPELKDADLDFVVDVHPQPPVQVEPSSLFLGTVEAGDKPVAAIHVTSVTGDRISVSRPVCIGCPIRFVVEPDGSGGSWVRVFVQPGNRGKRINGSIRIPVTMGGKQMIRTVPVMGTLR